MYPDELKHFLEIRNYKISEKELLKVISVFDNIQLEHIIYNVFENSYEIWDKFGNYYKFYVKGKIIKK